MGLFKKKVKTEAGEENIKLPRHIAIIMDGNGRWAKAKGLPRTAGHAAGAETFRKIATYCRDLGVEYLTVYAFSTENWKRPPEEVEAIMGLLGKYLTEAAEKMQKDNIRLRVIGDVSGLSPKLQEQVEKTVELSEGLSGFQANICVNYGGRDDIVRAAQKYAHAYKEGKAADLTEEILASNMYMAGIPDPDLVIRPGGEMRLSNFLLWETAYSELVFTDVLWPDFTAGNIDSALVEYTSRDRRYGGIKK